MENYNNQLPKHTPGPWMRSGTTVNAPGQGMGGFIVAEVKCFDKFSQTYNSLRAEHDAKLIAAAPEMLEALEQAREAVEGYARERWSNPEGWTEYRAIVNAINKAKGID